MLAILASTLEVLVTAVLDLAGPADDEMRLLHSLVDAGRISQTHILGSQTGKAHTPVRLRSRFFSKGDHARSAISSCRYCSPDYLDMLDDMGDV